MKEQQRIQQTLPEKNGKQPQPLLPVSEATFQENKTDEGDLQQLLTVVRRRSVLIGSVACVLFGTVWAWTLTRQATYEGKFQLLVEPVTAESKLAGLTQNQDPNTNQQQRLDYDTQIQVLQSPKIMAPIIKQISTRYPDISYESLMGNLKVSRLQETKILEVSYQSSEPQKIQLVLQQLAKGYLKYSLEERQTNVGQGNRFVDSQLPMLQARVNIRQRELQSFRQQYNFIDPQIKAEQLSQQLGTIDLQRLDTQKQLAETRASYATLQSPSGMVEALKEAPVYEKLVGQSSDLESQIAGDLTKFQENSPHIQLLRQKRENLQQVLRQQEQQLLQNKLAQVANQVSGLEVRSAKIAQAENNLSQQIKQLPTLARQYTDLQRELKVDSDSLNRFLEKRESLQIETAQKEVPWQLIKSPNIPQAPVSPNVPRNLILGAIAGLLAGLGAALLAERLNNVFHSPDELKEVTKLPLLGMIPFHKNLKQLSSAAEATVETKPEGGNLVFRNISNAQDYSYFPFLEAFRSLHTNMVFLGSSDKPIHSLVISSTVKSEGKSTVALNLAQAAAAMGRRVLLVDADLRLPQVHTLLGLPNNQGLSNVISTNLPVLDAIQQPRLGDNLFVLTSGQIPPDATKLLSSIKLRNIMEQLRQQFDLVIYDTPPVLGLADGRLIATYTDGIVVVVRASSTDRSLLKQALDGLKISRVPVLGTVINGVKLSSNAPYNYYYQNPLTKQSN